MSDRSRTTRALVERGALWTVTGYGATLALRLASNVILARLLFPEAFGLMALVAVVLQGLHMLSDVGIRQLVIQHKRGEDPTFVNTAWTVQIIRGLCLWLITVLIAVPFASAYEDPQLALLIPIAGLVSIISGFNSTSLYTEHRHLRLGRVTLLDLLAQVVSVVVMISFAIVYPSVWALVIGSLASHFVVLTFSHVWLARTLNRFRLDRSSRRELLQFGKWIFLSTLLTFLVGQSDKLIFGQLVTMEMLGIYAIAGVFAALPASFLARIGQSVIFPAYCRVLNAGDDFPRAFFGLRIPFVVLGVIGVSLMCLIAPALIKLLYDSRYQEAGWMLQILLIGTLFKLLEDTNGQALLAHGNAKMVAIGSFAKLVTMFFLIFVGYMHFGFAGAIAGYATSEVARYAVSVFATNRYAIGMFKIDVMLVTVGVAITGAGLHATSQLVAAGYDVLTGIGIAALMACGLWAIALWLLAAYGPLPQGFALRRILNG